MCPELYFDWALDNQHSSNILGVHGFLSLIVKSHNLVIIVVITIKCYFSLVQ